MPSIGAEQMPKILLIAVGLIVAALMWELADSPDAAREARKSVRREPVASPSPSPPPTPAPRPRDVVVVAADSGAELSGGELWAEFDRQIRSMMTQCIRNKREELSPVADCRRVLAKAMIDICVAAGEPRAACQSTYVEYCAHPRADRDFCEKP